MPTSPLAPGNPEPYIAKEGGEAFRRIDVAMVATCLKWLLILRHLEMAGSMLEFLRPSGNEVRSG